MLPIDEIYEAIRLGNVTRIGQLLDMAPLEAWKQELRTRKGRLERLNEDARRFRHREAGRIALALGVEVEGINMLIDAQIEWERVRREEAGQQDPPPGPQQDEQQ